MEFRFSADAGPASRVLEGSGRPPLSLPVQETIAAGTSEIQRNVIATRGAGPAARLTAPESPARSAGLLSRL
jgi:hypothetical protein